MWNLLIYVLSHLVECKTRYLCSRESEIQVWTCFSNSEEALVTNSRQSRRVFKIGRNPNREITAAPPYFCCNPADIFMGCGSSKDEEKPRVQDFMKLASETHFSLSEVEALHELFKKLSSSLVNDGYIRKEELMLALFRNSNKQNLFADRIFDLFDVNQNGQIDFGEFVRSLSIFHPRTPEAEKIAYAFRLYDLRQTGYIEREELKQMVLTLLTESDLNLSDDIVEAIVDKTFKEVDQNGDGRIDEKEWKEYAAKNPLLLRNMTLPYLMDVTLSFPSFVMHTEADESKLAK